MQRCLVTLRLLLIVVILALCGCTPRAAERFDPLQRASLHPLAMNKPAPDFFEGAVLGNGGMGAIVCTRPDSVAIRFGHNDVWDIRVAENNRDKLVTFEDLWARFKRDTPEDRAWFKEYCTMARENYAQPYPRPWPCGTFLLGFDRRRAELLGHRLHIDTGVCGIRFIVDGEPAMLEVWADMHADRLWMRMIDGQGRPVASPFTRVRLIPESGMKTTTRAAGDLLAFRQVLPILGKDRAKDKALCMTARVAGKVEPQVELAGPFVACVQMGHGLVKDLPDQPDDMRERRWMWRLHQLMRAGRRGRPTGGDQACSWRTPFWSEPGITICTSSTARPEQARRVRGCLPTGASAASARPGTATTTRTTTCSNRSG